jgi:hypothetical protein
MHAAFARPVGVNHCIVIGTLVVLLLESALLQKTTALSSFAGSPRTSCNCTAKRYR